MNLKKRSLVPAAILALFFLSLLQWAGAEPSATAAFDPQKTFSVKQLREDFTIFRQSLEEGHGGLYRYTPKAELADHFDKVYKQLTGAMTEMEFLKLLLPVVAHINDGHSGVNLSSAYNKYLRDRPVLFPFKLKFINKQACLYRNYSEKKDVRMGGEVIAINGHSMPEILAKLLPVIPSDAHIETSKFRKLEQTSRFGLFFIYYFGEAASYTVKYQPPGQENIGSFKVKGIKIKDVTRLFTERYPEAAKDEPPISLEYRDDIPILTIRTFGGYDYQKAKMDYPKFLEKAFKEFAEKKVKHLIIDLRNNGGGSDLFGRLLAAYFMDKPYRYYGALEIKNNTFSFLKYTNVPPRERVIGEERAKKNERGWYDLLQHPNLGEHEPLQPTFTGQVYILINGGSFSASGESTSVIHFHKKALFVGEECGAGYYGNTSGFMPTVTLPNSKLGLRVPLVRYTMAVSGYPADRGIIPEYPVSPTMADIMQKKDTVLDYVLNLIKQNRNEGNLK